LRSMGVDVELGRSVVEVEQYGIRFSDGERLDAAAVIWAAGVTVAGTLASHLATKIGPSGRALVGADLRVDGSENVWSIGDAAAIADPKATFYPQLAPLAIQSGRHCAEQILRVLRGEATEVFRYHDKGIMATIGRRAAVAKLPHAGVIKGTIGWLAWLGLHLWYLVGFRNRLRVLINWTWRYFDWPSWRATRRGPDLGGRDLWLARRVPRRRVEPRRQRPGLGVARDTTLGHAGATRGPRLRRGPTAL